MKPPHPSTPSPEQFSGLARTHDLIPVYRRVTADLETPVSAFLRVAENVSEAFLLESVEGGERLGRYTFMGVEPYLRLTARGSQVTVEEGGESRTVNGDFFDTMRQRLRGFQPAELPGLPPFTGGAVGFVAYDAVRGIERLPVLAADELGLPDADVLFFDQVVAFDHVKSEILLIVTVNLQAGQTYENAEQRLDRLEQRLSASLPPSAYSAGPVPGTLAITPRTSRADYLRAVERVKEYVAAGDVFQCVLSQRFDCVPGVPALAIYRALRIVNPSPYMFFLRFAPEGHEDAVHIVGSSPELLVRVRGRRVEYRPIAGTRPRGVADADDRELERSLREDEKEVAEHIMLVDLGRNDLGRVSEYGSVQVNDLMFVERYSHVMHLVTSLEGRLRPELDALDAFRACFPAGTLTGAPKIRAMEIIEELEPARRGVYGGAIVYADFAGNLDSCIAIRTLVLKGQQGSIQAGAGIVADSVPESEWAECGNKAQAVVRAIERARSS